MLFMYLKGLALGGSLIVAIGAQNAFVLSQGVRKKYNIIIPLICSFLDAILISLGVFGIGNIFALNEKLTFFASLGGAIFLFWYGLKSLFSVFKDNKLEGEQEGPQNIKAAILLTVAITLLNPHVYIDTIFLIGSISSQFDGIDKLLFGLGAISASFMWFFLLSLGGNIFSPLFKKALAWKILDAIIFVIMWSISLSLLLDLFN